MCTIGPTQPGPPPVFGGGATAYAPPPPPFGPDGNPPGYELVRTLRDGLAAAGTQLAAAEAAAAPRSDGLPPDPNAGIRLQYARSLVTQLTQMDAELSPRAHLLPRGVIDEVRSVVATGVRQGFLDPAALAPAMFHVRDALAPIHPAVRAAVETSFGAFAQAQAGFLQLMQQVGNTGRDVTSEQFAALQRTADALPQMSAEIRRMSEGARTDPGLALTALDAANQAFATTGDAARFVDAVRSVAPPAQGFGTGRFPTLPT